MYIIFKLQKIKDKEKILKEAVWMEGSRRKNTLPMKEQDETSLQKLCSKE